MAPALACAADAGMGEEQNYFADLPVVVTATRLPQSLVEVPAAVTVIDREMIDASGATTIPDVLRLVPGFQVGHVSGSRISVTYHGMTDDYARRMQVLVDGRSVYLSATGSVDWADLPLSLDDVQRIEVTRGPNSVAYGANAFLAVINIITSHPRDTQGVMLHHLQGDDGSQTSTLRYGAGGPDYQYRLTAESHVDHGYSPYPGYDYHDDKRLQTLNYRGEFRPAVNDYLSMQVGARKGIVDAGYYGDLTEPPHTEYHKRVFGQLKWKHDISSRQDVEVQLYHIDSHISAHYNTATLSQIMTQLTGIPITSADIQTYFSHPDGPLAIDQSVYVKRTDLEFQHRLTASDSVRMVWGAELRRDVMDAPGFAYGHDVIGNNLSRLFGHVEWQPAEKWRVNTGLMYENSEMGGASNSPRLAVNYLFDPRHALRFSYTKAVRSPAVLEQYANYAARFSDGTVVDQIWHSDGGMQSEKITSVELGFVGQEERLHLQYGVKVFSNTLEDLIQTPIDRTYSEPNSALCAPPYNMTNFCRATVFRNGGRAKAHGYEVQLRYEPRPGALAALSYSEVVSEDTYLTDVSNTAPDVSVSNDLTVPKRTISLLAQVPLPARITASAMVYHTDQMQLIGGDTTKATTTADARLAKGFNVAGHKASLELRVHNLLGSYYDYLTRIQQERTGYLGFKLEY